MSNLNCHSIKHKELLDHITERLVKIESLVAVMDMEDFWDFDRSLLRNYVWTIQELLNQSIETSELLYKQIPVYQEKK